MKIKSKIKEVLKDEKLKVNLEWLIENDITILEEVIAFFEDTEPELVEKKDFEKYRNKKFEFEFTDTMQILKVDDKIIINDKINKLDWEYLMIYVLELNLLNKSCNCDCKFKSKNK